MRRIQLGDWLIAISAAATAACWLLVPGLRLEGSAPGVPAAGTAE